MATNVVHDDGELIQATLHGDSAAFGHLVRKYQDRLFTALMQVAGSRSDAEDVVQESLVTAYTKLATFGHGSSFYTWLYRIAFNAAISQRRRRKPSTSLDLKREFTGEEPQDESQHPQEDVLRQERAALVQQALSQLNDEHRAILVLREMEGCDYDTIAEILNLPVGTVRSRLHRARLQMRAHLNVYFDENAKR